MRTIWNGSISFGLVSIPVGLALATKPAARQSDVSFRMLHRECRTPIRQKRWCPTHDREVGPDELVKGWEVAKGEFVIVEDADLEAIEQNDDSRSIEITRFVPITEVDPIYFDRTYYLAPDGQVAADAFAVMREGMKGKIGVGKLALYGREYLIAVKPHEKGLVMYTLHHAAEIRGMGDIEELATVPAKVRPEEVQLAKQVISTFARKLDLGDYRDEYREGLQKIIDAKIAGEEVVAPAMEMPPKVVNLMEALRKSLDTVSASKKKPVKAELPKKPMRAEPKRRRA
jgi:DNA end-binding protein Ku